MPSAKKVVFRSSVKGRFVTEAFAKAHPRETEKERVSVPQPAPKKPKGGA